MAHLKDGSGTLLPPTEVLTRGFDPSLSFGSARPAVFRSSTYVFASPEAAERAFSIAGDRIPTEEGKRADLIYSRISHPNAEILEDQMVPLERGARDAAVFNSGMAAIMTAFFVRASSEHDRSTIPPYGGTVRLIHEFLEPAWRHWHCSGRRRSRASMRRSAQRATRASCSSKRPRILP